MRKFSTRLKYDFFHNTQLLWIVFWSFLFVKLDFVVKRFQETAEAVNTRLRNIKTIELESILMKHNFPLRRSHKLRIDAFSIKKG